MKFSILVPIYNVEDYLPAMLESLDRQNFTDFEAVLVNDGSTDSCPSICDTYQASHPAVKVVHKPNGGLVSARRAGLKAAEGEYIIFVDADDLLQADALSSINDVISQYGSDVVYYNAYVYDGKTREPFFEHELPEGPVADKRDIYDKLFLSYSMNSMCLKAMKRELFDIDRDYSEFYRCAVAEDLLQTVPVLLNAKSVYYLDKPLYDYRVTSGMTHKCNPDYYFSNKRISLDIRERLRSENIEDFDQKAAFHLLIAAYAGTTQMQYGGFDRALLESIRSDDQFVWAWQMAWNSKYAAYFSKKQKLLLKLLHSGNWMAIKLLFKVKGGK